MGLSRQPRVVCNRHFGDLGTELPRLQYNLNMNKRTAPTGGAGNTLPETTANEDAGVNVPSWKSQVPSAARDYRLHRPVVAQGGLRAWSGGSR